MDDGVRDDGDAVAAAVVVAVGAARNKDWWLIIAGLPTGGTLDLLFPSRQ